MTTDHISPAGSIKKDSPAGRYLQENSVPVSQFNSYGSRRGNDRVMTRGTFANIRVRNLLAAGTEGGVTMSLGDAASETAGSPPLTPDAPRADDVRPQAFPDVDDPNVVQPGVQPEECPGGAPAVPSSRNTPGFQDDSAGGRHRPDVTGEAELNEGTDRKESQPAPSRKGDGKDHPPAGAGGYDNADPTATDPKAKPAPPHAPNAPEVEEGDPDHPTTVGSADRPDPESVVPIFDAAVAYRACQTSEPALASRPESRPGFTPLIVLAGKDYGMGSSRDWAAKGTLLLGVRAVIAESYERIHRSNLVGMGVLPLQFADGEGRESLKLTGRERFDIDIPENLTPGQHIRVTARREEGGRRRRDDFRRGVSHRYSGGGRLLSQRRYSAHGAQADGGGGGVSSYGIQVERLERRTHWRPRCDSLGSRARHPHRTTTLAALSWQRKVACVGPGIDRTPASGGLGV